MNKRHYEHTLPNIRGSLSNTYDIPQKYYLLVRNFYSFFLNRLIFAFVETNKKL